MIYKECNDEVLLCKRDLEEVFRIVENILHLRYDLLIASEDYMNEPIKLVSISEEKRKDD